MADVILFHHAHGLTDGILALADDLRAAGHEVTTPDLYDGRVFPTLADGMAYAEQVGLATLEECGVESAQWLPPELYYLGFCLGAMPAQRLAQQREGARGAILYHSAVPVGSYAEQWPEGVALQLHVMEDDPTGDQEVMRDLAEHAGGELFTYPGHEHLFTDRSLSDHDPEAAALALERTLALLA